MPAPAAPVTAPAAVTPAAPSISPKSPVPPLGSPAAHMETAKKFFSPDPAKAPAAAPAAEPAKPAAPADPAAPSIIKKADAPAPAPAPAPAAEPAKPEVFPEDSLPEPATEAAKAGWKELKAMTKTERNRATVAEARIKELEAKQSQAPATSADTAELDRLKAEHKTLSDRLLTLDLQNHPDFHRQFVAPREKAFAESAQLLTDNGVEAKVDFGALLSKPRAEFAKTVSELASKMNTFDAQTFTANMRQAFELRGQESAALTKAGDVHKQLQQQAQQVQRREFDAVAKEVTAIFQKQEIKPEMTPEDRAVAEAYNQSVDGMRARAEARAFGKVTERDVASMAYNEVQFEHMVKHAVPVMERYIKSQGQVITDLRAQLEGLRGGKAPAASAGAAEGAVVPQNESIEQSAKRVWGRT